MHGGLARVAMLITLWVVAVERLEHERRRTKDGSSKRAITSGSQGWAKVRSERHTCVDKGLVGGWMAGWRAIMSVRQADGPVLRRRAGLTG